MKLVSFRIGGEEHAGIEYPRGVIDITKLGFGTAADILERGEAGFADMEKAAEVNIALFTSTHMEHQVFLNPEYLEDFLVVPMPPLRGSDEGCVTSPAGT